MVRVAARRAAVNGLLPGSEVSAGGAVRGGGSCIRAVSVGGAVRGGESCNQAGCGQHVPFQKTPISQAESWGSKCSLCPDPEPMLVQAGPLAVKGRAGWCDAGRELWSPCCHILDPGRAGFRVMGRGSLCRGRSPVPCGWLFILTLCLVTSPVDVTASTLQVLVNDERLFIKVPRMTLVLFTSV